MGVSGREECNAALSLLNTGEQAPRGALCLPGKDKAFILMESPLPPAVQHVAISKQEGKREKGMTVGGGKLGEENIFFSICA